MSAPERTSGDRAHGLEAATVALILAVALGLLAWRAVPGATATALDHLWLDAAVARHASDPVDTSAVTVVLVDDQSLGELQERWPLRRRTWADFLRRLSGYDPAAVALDAWFEVAEPSAEIGLALDLADQLRLLGLTDSPAGASLARELDTIAEDLDGDLQLGRALARTPTLLGFACVASGAPAVEPAPVEAPIQPRLSCPATSGNLPALALAAHGQASLDMLHDGDGNVRRYAYLLGVGERSYPSLALAAVRLARPDAYAPALARVAGRDGAAPFLRVIHPDRFDTVRFSDVLMAAPDDPSLRARLADRIVFVGVSAQGTEDTVFNALGIPLPGVFLHANAAIDLLDDRHAWSDGEPGQLGGLAGALCLLLLGVAGARVRTAPAVLAVGTAAGAGWAASGLAAFSAGWLVPVTPVLLGAGGWTTARLGFSWWRVDRARREAQAARERLLGELQVRNEELRESLETLRRTRSAKERMESELQIGREIQLAMVPDGLPAISVGAVSLRAVLQPAREVGGDFYDALAIDDDKLCVVVGDVSGKGVPAALFMAVTQTLIASAARTGASPGTILTHANASLARNNESCMFVTLFVAILDLRTGALTYANAGHNPPYLARAGGAWDRLDARHGPVVGAVETFDYTEDQAFMGAGDLLFLYTDGVTEAMDPSSALYGEARMLSRLTSAGTDAVDALVGDLMADLRVFQDVADQADDITLLALRVDRLGSDASAVR